MTSSLYIPDVDVTTSGSNTITKLFKFSVGSDEEHLSSYQINHNNNISTTHDKSEDGLRKTILHQTLTRHDDHDPAVGVKEDMKEESKATIRKKILEENSTTTATAATTTK